MNWWTIPLSALGKIFARPQSEKTGVTGHVFTVAGAKLAQELGEKVQSGEIADLARLAEEHARRRLEAETASLEADVMVKRSQAIKTLAEAGEIANRTALSASRSDGGELGRVEEALHRLKEDGGRLMLDLGSLENRPRLIEGRGNVELPISISATGVSGAGSMAVGQGEALTDDTGEVITDDSGEVITSDEAPTLQDPDRPS